MTNNLETMKKVNKTLVCSILMLTIGFTGSAQSGWNWGEQVDLAKEKNVVYTDAYKAKNYAATIEPLSWLLENTPDLNPSIYINGVKIYEALAKQETDPVKKEEYIQTGLNLFDKRIEVFGKKGNVLDRKSSYAYRFYNKDKSKYEYLYNLMSENFEVNGSKTGAGNLVAYMNVIYKYRFIGGDLPDEQVIDLYSAISGALEEQKAKVDVERQKRYNSMLGQVDKLLTATKVKISCEFVETKLGPKLEETGELNMAKKIFQLMLTGKCTDSPLAIKASGIIQENEPTFTIAKFLAQKNIQNGDTESGIKYYQDAANLTEENSEKAEVYVSIARIQAKMKQKATARNSARRALSYDPSFSDAYKLIGDLYMGSSTDCNQNESKVDDRAIFIAAYDQYRRAGHSPGMANAKAQFPSIEEIFNEGKEEGQSITIGCWINTTVKLERRPAN
jgi:tetratricopeptide (TPR) repeat protein